MVTFAIRSPIAHEELPALYRRVSLLLERSGAAVAVCDVAGVVADAVSVDALARLQLAARRHRCRIELRNASSELRDLIAFLGLDDVLAV
jgi:ABC-type transporter Mla MlaB component